MSLEPEEGALTIEKIAERVYINRADFELKFMKKTASETEYEKKKVFVAEINNAWKPDKNGQKQKSVALSIFGASPVQKIVQFSSRTISTLTKSILKHK